MEADDPLLPPASSRRPCTRFSDVLKAQVPSLSRHTITFRIQSIASHGDLCLARWMEGNNRPDLRHYSYTVCFRMAFRHSLAAIPNLLRDNTEAVIE